MKISLNTETGRIKGEGDPTPEAYEQAHTMVDFLFTQINMKQAQAKFFTLKGKEKLKEEDRFDDFIDLFNNS